MKEMNYNPFGNKGLILEFKCKDCPNNIVTDEIPIPAYDLMSETVIDSNNCDEDSVICNNCNKEYNITICASNSDGYIEISELDAAWNVNLIEISDEMTDDIPEV